MSYTAQTVKMKILLAERPARQLLTVGTSPKGCWSWITLHFTVEDNVSAEDSMDVLWFSHPFGWHYETNTSNLKKDKNDVLVEELRDSSSQNI